MGFSRQKYWSGLPFHPPRDLPNPGIKPRSPALQADSLPPEPPGKLSENYHQHYRKCALLMEEGFMKSDVWTSFSSWFISHCKPHFPAKLRVEVTDINLCHEGVLSSHRGDKNWLHCFLLFFHLFLYSQSFKVSQSWCYLSMVLFIEFSLVFSVLCLVGL